MVVRLTWLIAVLFATIRVDAISERDHVVILADSRQDESVALARYYAAKRRIPEGNIIAIPMPAETTISWSQYVLEIHVPLLARLVADGWIGARVLEEKDLAGRPLIELKGHRIVYLVTCRGVPLRIENSPELLEAESADLPPRYLTNRSAVDSELSLLTRSNVPTSGVVTNPLFRQKEPDATRMASVIRVSRLDGPSWESCRRLVDSAIEGEERGLVGRAYIDSGGPNKEGDAWLKSIGQKIDALGFDLERESTKDKMGLTARMDGAVLYFGWHSSKVVGPVLNRGFSFPAGAVAVHIYSFSAGSLRRGWVASLVGAGVAATVGNVYEPYLQLTHNLDLFFESIEAGSTVGEAAAYSMPGQSWQSILFGDPLYRPFKKSFEAQWERREDLGEDGQYLVLRQANLLERDGKRSEAAVVLEKALKQYPNGLALAYRHAAIDRGEKADESIAHLENLALSRSPPPEEWGLAADAAERLRSYRRERGALMVYQDLLQQTVWSETWQRFLVDRALPLAERIGARDLMEVLTDLEIDLTRPNP